MPKKNFINGIAMSIHTHKKLIENKLGKISHCQINIIFINVNNVERHICQKIIVH